MPDRVARRATVLKSMQHGNGTLSAGRISPLGRKTPGPVALESWWFSGNPHRGRGGPRNQGRRKAGKHRRPDGRIEHSSPPGMSKRYTAWILTRRGPVSKIWLRCDVRHGCWCAEREVSEWPGSSTLENRRIAACCVVAAIARLVRDAVRSCLRPSDPSRPTSTHTGAMPSSCQTKNRITPFFRAVWMTTLTTVGWFNHQ
jgi:hypothetical protein